MASSFKSILLAILSLAILSCETVLSDVDPAKFGILKEQIVVTGFLNPQDDTLWIRVNKTIPVFGAIEKGFVNEYDPVLGDSVRVYADNKFVPDAAVSISGSSGSTILKYHLRNKSYYFTRSQFQIKAGSSYEIKVNAINQTATAKTTVPEDVVSIQNMVVNYFVQTNRDFFRADSANGYRVNFDFKDPIGKENYYKVWGELSYTVQFPQPANKDFIFRKVNNYMFWPGFNDRIIIDKLADGKTIKSQNGEVTESIIRFCRAQENQEECEKATISPAYPHLLRVQLWNMSKELYDYQLSRQKYFQADDNPFSEPSPIYTNVKGGLGIFGSYTKSESKREVR